MSGMKGGFRGQRKSIAVVSRLAERLGKIDEPNETMRYVRESSLDTIITDIFGSQSPPWKILSA
jgi:hypothetical protein